MSANHERASKELPNLTTIREEQTAKELLAAIREWSKAGKPRKR